MKLYKQSSGVGKYLKWLKEKVTGGSLPNNHQQTKPATCLDCANLEACLATRGGCVNFGHYVRRTQQA